MGARLGASSPTQLNDRLLRSASCQPALKGQQGTCHPLGDVHIILHPHLQGKWPYGGGGGLGRQVLVPLGGPCPYPYSQMWLGARDMPGWWSWPWVVTLCSSLPQPWPLKLGFSSPYEGVLVCTCSVGPPCMTPGAVHAGFPPCPWSHRIDRARANLLEVHAGGGPLLLTTCAEDD